MPPWKHFRVSAPALLSLAPWSLQAAPQALLAAIAPLPYRLTGILAAVLLAAGVGVYLWLRRRSAERAARVIGKLWEDLQRSQDALRISEARFRELVQNVDAILWEAELPSWRPTFVSQRIVDLLGYPVEKWLDEPDFWVRTIHPEDRERAVELARKTKERELEYRVVAADGRVLWFRTLARPAALDEQGRVRQLRGVSVDVTERRRAEEALADSEEKYRLLFEDNPHPMWVFDVETLSFLAVNEAAVKHYGYSREEFLAMTIKEIRPAEDIPRLLESIATHPEGSQKGELWKHRRKDGALIDVEVFSNRLTFAGRPAGIVLATDVTERRRLEEQLRQAQKMEAVGQLAGGVAHDFNNLLGIILGYGDLLWNQLEAGDPRRKHAEQIKAAAERGASLTRQLLAFGRKQVLEPRVLNLNSVVSRMGEMLRRLIGEHIDLVIVPDPSLGQVKADPGQIEQVLMNLAVNARDAMAEGGQLMIDTANVEVDEGCARQHVGLRSGSYVMFAVSDTGCGMDAATQARIFEPFFTTKGRGKGTGLGLATVYGIVKQSGGYIAVYSEIGQGTTFKVYLPRVEQTAPAAAPNQPSQVRFQGTETILLVEDQEALREMCREFLELNGYKTLVAGHGAEALQVSQNHAGPIHLMITDMIMPGINGRELAQRLAPLRPEMKVIYVSGYTDDVVLRSGVSERNLLFLQKPFNLADLGGKVRQALDLPQETPVEPPGRHARS